MNSRSCCWLIVSALVITASGAWAQCNPVLGAKNIAALKQQAIHGKAAAQCSLGAMYEDGKGLPQDYAQAALWYRKAAEQGDAEAQFFLGSLYLDGHGVPQDVAQGEAWLHKADEQGYAGARLMLIILYEAEMDRRAPEVYPEAVTWFRKSANQGFDLAQRKLGYFYYSGYGVPQDNAQAAFWYRKAAEQGDASAEKDLGTLYYTGQGLPQDYTQALIWWRKAAEHDDAGAQFKLGHAYYKGLGVPRTTQKPISGSIWRLRASWATQKRKGLLRDFEIISRHTWRQPICLENRNERGSGLRRIRRSRNDGSGGSQPGAPSLRPPRRISVTKPNDAVILSEGRLSDRSRRTCI